MSGNLHKLYYRDYFRDVEFSFQEAGGDITISSDESKLKNSLLISSADKSYLNEALKVFEPDESYVGSRFVLTVGYPGLVTGVGISHEARVKGEFKLGIHLDYTTGLPVIYGSTVKGVIRSAFAEADLLSVLPVMIEDSSLPYDEINKLSGVLKSISGKLGSAKIPLSETVLDIFGGNEDDNHSAYCRDVFFDAYVCGLSDKQTSMLASDSITPHDGSQVKNPIPITFVRIASGSKIKFRFKLVESVLADGNVVLSVVEKEALYKSILVAFGVGAKTKVGYGRLG